MDETKKPNLLAYRTSWAIYWLMFLAVLPVGMVNMSVATILFMGAFGLAFALVFWSCPFCGKTVGLRKYGPLTASVPGVRKCMHCKRLLVSFKQ